jgi:hypothetical protein
VGLQVKGSSRLGDNLWHKDGRCGTNIAVPLIPCCCAGTWSTLMVPRGCHLTPPTMVSHSQPLMQNTYSKRCCPAFL